MTRARCLAAARRLPWLVVAVAVASGCTRNFFRQRADKDVDALLAEKSIDPRWAVRDWAAYPDGRARFADADKPDQPKKPPDDPAAAALSPNSQPVRSKFCSGPDQEGAGYLEFLRHCDQHNRTVLAKAAAQDGQPLATLGAPTGGGGRSSLGNDGTLRTGEQGWLITLDQAVELSMFNSRDFQDRREDLYLSALPVTFQRFQFYPQLFAGVQAVRNWNASEAPGGPGSAWTITSTGRWSQLFPTGATVVANLANQLVVNLGSGNPTVSLSTLTLSAVQPLLRGGGWAVTLEPLTQAERTLVYGVRSFARFRSNFYVYVAGGADQFNAPYGYAGLALRGVGPSLNAPSQGYLPTLLTLALQRVEQTNLVSLTGYLELYREFQGRGDVSELQVGQVEQQILNSQSRLLGAGQNIQNALDQFKLQLGIPTRTPLELDDGPIRPMSDMLAAANRARDEFQALRTEADQFPARVRNPLQALAGTAIAPIPLDIPVRDKIEDLMFNSPVTRDTEQFRRTIRPRWARWRGLTTDRLRAEIKRMLDELRTLQVDEARYEARGQTVPADLAGRLVTLPRELAVGQLELALRAYEAARGKREGTVRDVAVLYEEVVNSFIRVMTEARIERRARIRAAWPKVPAVTVDGTDLLAEDLDEAQAAAAQVALANRIELMNSRAQVIDAWRRVTVTANSLLGVLNVGYNLNTTSPPNANEPLALGGSRSQHQLILSGELPLVRRAERNEYRTALIAYQRARRNLQATEDFILADVRADLRSLRVLAANYRIQQRAVEVAYDQVENSLDVLQAPPQPAGGPAQPGQAGAQLSNSAGYAAALTQQLLGAQNSLLQAQNNLYTVWVNYLIARMTFYRDIERLPLDARGVWIDEPPSSPSAGPEPLPPPEPVGAAGAERFADLRPAGAR